MWVINDKKEVTFIEAKNLKMFMAKGWKSYTPSMQKIEPTITKTKKNNNKK